MRGMKKWLPFKSLNGQYQVLEEMEKERKKVSKPELSIDEIEEINLVLTSLQRGDRVKVTYYQNGQIVKRNFIFLKVDTYQKRLIGQGISLSFEDLLDIHRIEENKGLQKILLG